MNNKPRVDSVLSQLPEDEQAQVYDWLITLGYTETLCKLAQPPARWSWVEKPPLLFASFLQTLPTEASHRRPCRRKGEGLRQICPEGLSLFVRAGAGQRVSRESWRFLQVPDHYRSSPGCSRLRRGFLDSDSVVKSVWRVLFHLLRLASSNR